MGRPKRFENPQQVTFVIEAEMADSISDWCRVSGIPLAEFFRRSVTEQWQMVQTQGGNK
jgi:hypothetical protein